MLEFANFRVECLTELTKYIGNRYIEGQCWLFFVTPIINEAYDEDSDKLLDCTYSLNFIGFILYTIDEHSTKDAIQILNLIHDLSDETLNNIKSITRNRLINEINAFHKFYGESVLNDVIDNMSDIRTSFGSIKEKHRLGDLSNIRNDAVQLLNIRNKLAANKKALDEKRKANMRTRFITGLTILLAILSAIATYLEYIPWRKFFQFFL